MKIANYWLRQRPLSIRFGSAALRQGLSRGGLPSMRSAMVVVFATGLALAGCTGSMNVPFSSSSNSSSSSSSSSRSSAEGLLGLSGAVSLGGQPHRDLTLPEKKIISDAVALSIKDPGSAQYRWPTISASDRGRSITAGWSMPRVLTPHTTAGRRTSSKPKSAVVKSPRPWSVLLPAARTSDRSQDVQEIRPRSWRHGLIRSKPGSERRPISCADGFVRNPALRQISVRVYHDSRSKRHREILGRRRH